MIKFRPLLAGLLVLAAGAPRAALVTTLNVTTTLDEDGTNGSACSLREAVTAVTTRKPYGGCPAGSAFDDNVIQLESENYVLTRGELVLSDEMAIFGNDSQKAVHKEMEDPLTGNKPRRFRPDYEDADTAVGKTGTYITASASSRIFNVTAPVSIKDVVLVGSASASLASPSAVTANGGVIYASNSLVLNNVIIRGGSASGSSIAAGNGGAVYLGGDGTSLTFTDVTIEDSHADNKGGAIAMLCSVGLNPYALHSVTLTRTLLRGNSATLGAGAIEFCGNTSGSLTSSTLSANTSAAASGALAFVQGSEIGLGQVILSYVTAAEQVGHVLAANGIANVQTSGSLLAAFDTPGATAICHNPNPAIYMIANIPSGNTSALSSDGSCTGIMSASGNNVSIPLGTLLQDVLVPIKSPVDYYPASATGAPYGLTDYYLPKLVPGSLLIDRAEALTNCLSNDQRNVERKSGTACDIGAVERLQVTARDDTEDSKRDTDRKAIVDVLLNDSFGEDDATGPFKFAPNTPDDTSTPANEFAPAVILVDDALGLCEWKLSDDADNPGKLVVRSDGVLTTEDAPIVCTYQVIDTESRTSTTTASVTVQIKNAAPNALNDAYLRPVGEASVSFNPMTNDDDKGDGIYGLVKHDATTTSPVTYGPETAWATFYPIEIDTAPALGDVIGATSGLCPGSSALPKTCLTPPLRYVAKNNMSPFADTFTYRVYDKDGETSNAATVTIYTDAQDPDHGGGAGSFDLLGGLVLSLLGLRRLRRL